MIGRAAYQTPQILCKLIGNFFMKIRQINNAFDALLSYRSYGKRTCTGILPSETPDKAPGRSVSSGLWCSETTGEFYNVHIYWS